MSKEKRSYSNYKNDLMDKIKAKKLDIKFKESQLYGSGVKIDDKWIKEYEKLNLLRVDLATLVSRLDHLDRPSQSTTEYKLNTNTNDNSSKTE